jgi:hypothetical protein
MHRPADKFGVRTWRIAVWEKPGFTEIAMNAEIGAYQDDSDYGNMPVADGVQADEAGSASN